MKILKFGAVWCAKCLVMKSRWKEIEAKYPQLETHYYDFDTDKKAIEKYEINKTLPVFVFLDKTGNEFLRLNGEVEKNKLIEIINQNLDK